MRTIRFNRHGTPVYAVVERDRAYPVKDGPWSVPPSVGKNYRSRSAEPTAEPSEAMLFLKPPTTIVGPGASIRRPGTRRLCNPCGAAD